MKNLYSEPACTSFCVLIWEDQTAFGPFNGHEAAIKWAETEFNSSWEHLLNLKFKVIAVEPIPTEERDK